MNSKDIPRREFLSGSGRSALGLGAGLTILANSRSVHGTPANEKVSLGMIGVRGRGDSLASGFLERDDCEITHVCDVDTGTGTARSKQYGQRQGGKRVKYIQDYRKFLEEASIDAVVVATPDHWHGPLTVFSCQAGKDVYVEKPASHNPWEGQQMVKAARKYKRIVQVGMQNRSAPYNLEAKKFIEEGKLGNIHLCRVFNMKSQGNFTLPPDSDPPPGFNWDMWNGPAPERRYNSTIRGQGWHHLWDYAGGDTGNDGVHQLDLARWLVGVDVPNSVHCSGGRFEGKGDAETPDTQIATYDFDDLVMTFELTLYTPYMLKTDGEIRNTDMFPYWPQNATRIEIYGTKGVMCVGRHGGGWEVYVRPQSRKPVVTASKYGRFPDPPHKENFVQCIRSRKLPNADVLIGHRSALLVHYANISYRVGGQKLVIDPATDRFVDNPEAAKLFKREYRRPWVIEEEV
ncbi:MAG: Gfo/Idh/MocA family oxidoreductase [Candidatus Nealsonbacteria bacterium]|nr:Gfo/Idh/MocA family oxidoreductase [Candidatus Nealsonbacteria bacterium]